MAGQDSIIEPRFEGFYLLLLQIQMAETGSGVSESRGYSDTDRDLYSSMAELDLDIPWRPRPTRVSRRLVDITDTCPQPRHVRSVYVQTGPPPVSRHLPEPIQLSHASTWQRYGDTYEHVVIPRTLGVRHVSCLDLGLGCCTRTIAPPASANRVQFQVIRPQAEAITIN